MALVAAALIVLVVFWLGWRVGNGFASRSLGIDLAVAARSLGPSYSRALRDISAKAVADASKPRHR